MALEHLRGFTLANLHERLALEDNAFDAWLEELGLLHSQRTCRECGSGMAPKRIADRNYGNWRCTRKECRKEIGFLQGTFFAGSHLTTKQIFHLCYLWSQNYGTYDQLEHETGISRPAICDWLNFFRDVCGEYIGRRPLLIGGAGVHVEIDETCVVRRKYARGRVPEKQQIWLFGGVERNTEGKQCFLVAVERRRAEDLIPLIQRHILPGSIIHSDLWRAYNSIPTLPQGYTHQTVNHSVNFIDPQTGSYTQNAEAMWHHFKQFRPRCGNNSNTYDTYFPEFMWRKHWGGINEVFYNFWHHVSLIYECE